MLDFADSQPDIRTVQVDVTSLWASLKDNPEFFIHFFLKEQIRKGVPEFHVIEFQKMTVKDILRYACAIPRDHAKTTLAKLSAVWHYLFTQHRFILYLCAVHKLAVNAVNDIVEFLEDPNLSSLVHIDWIKKQDGVGLYIFDLTLFYPSGTVTKRCILLAAGAGQALRGMNVDNKRPDLAIVDDLEKKEAQPSAAFESQQRKHRGTCAERQAT